MIEDKLVLRSILRLRNEALDLGMKELSLTYNECAGRLVDRVMASHMVSFKAAVEAVKHKP